MMRKSKSIVIATAITMLLSATAAFADTTSSNIVQAPKFSQTQSGEVHGWLKSDLVSLVTSRTLTQTQKNAIQIAIQTPTKVGAVEVKLKRGDNGGFKTVPVGLVTSGTLTQAQEDAIQSAILTPPKVSVAKGILKRGDKGGFKTVPVGLVTSGTLTQAQEGAIQGAITL
jgi:hypothetical protein